MKTMTTWQDYAKRQGAAVTTWNYDPKRGFLQSKRYADGTGPEYDYLPSGKIRSRKWARGIVTTYGYTAAGELETIAYSDKQTPSIRHEYDRQGRRVKTVQGEMVTTRSYSDAGQMLSESYQGGVLDGLGVFNRYDDLSRRIELSARNSSVLTRHAFIYDAASRLDTVAEGENSAQYHYVADSPLVEEIVFKQGDVVRMKTRKEYDRLNRLKSIESLPANDQTLRYGYQYNQPNQRTQVQMPDQTAWEYGYDALGQVIRANNSGAKRNASGVARFEYAYDDIGNRKRAAADAKEQQYQSDALNRYQAVSSGQQADTLQYDADGNLIRDGQWTYTWDAENRLVSMESVSGVPPNQRKRLEFTYDSQSRRINKKVYHWDGRRSAFSLKPTVFLSFIYDGWNLVAELSEVANTKSSIRNYVWGLDLSGSLQGAGGVGGLLWVVDRRTSDLFAMAYDGNGNNKGIVDANTGNWSAQYEYSPFGETIMTTGSKAQSNPFRFSTKYTDEETELLYYGFRYYQPASGKWISRDPIEEGGGEDLYAILQADAINNVDFLGMSYVTYLHIFGLNTLTTDRYTNPPGYGEGDSDGGMQYAYTRIKVYSGNPDGLGTCNSIYSVSGGCCAGAILVYDKENCPGHYTLYFVVELTISASGSVGRASGILQGQPGPLFHNSHLVTPANSPHVYNDLIMVDVVATDRESHPILLWEPTIAMQPAPMGAGFAEASARITYVCTEKND
jgi:RHS repeat-associated protein